MGTGLGEKLSTLFPVGLVIASWEVNLAGLGETRGAGPGGPGAW